MSDTPIPRSLLNAFDVDPALRSLRIAIVDINGCLRGKRLPRADAPKALDGMRMPLSLSLQDIWGRDVEDNPMVLMGDADAIVRPTGRAAIPMTWLNPGSALLPMWFEHTDGRPSETDPRQVLASVLKRFQAKGLRPVVAMELEFYLLPAENAKTPEHPLTGAPVIADGVLSIDALDGFEAVLADIEAACELADIPIGAAIAEGGPSQFEINFAHVDDALKAADDAILFKTIVRGVARAHGLVASFMAKPLANKFGSGQHVHISVLDETGANIFDNGGPEGSERLHHAVAGLLETMPEAALFFAPHLNSYRRLSGAHAPGQIGWAYENRFAAVRIPDGPNAARRIEHRVSGADANPYLVLASVLAGMFHGLEAAQAPAPAVSGNLYELDLPRLADSWEQSVLAFEAGEVLRRYLPEPLMTGFAMAKRQEMARFAARVSEFELASYLDVV